MDYEKAYKEALERAKKLYGKYCINNVLETIFPELKESEDEKIRKELIQFFQRFPYDRLNDENLKPKEAVAWLEKQGEQKWREEDEAHLHSVTTHLEQWIERHPNTCGADIQCENLAWLKSLKQRMEE